MRSQQVGGWLVALLEFGAGVLTMPALAQDCPELVGSEETLTVARDVAVSGGYAYVVGQDFRVIDIRVPSAPAEVGFIATGGASALAVAGGYAYVGTHWWEGYAGLSVIDVSTPSAPILAGGLDLGMQDAKDVAASDGYVYLTTEYGLKVIDVSTPSAPVQVGSLGTLGFPLGVALSGRYAHVADWEGGLRVIDVTTPSSPFEVGSLVTRDSAYGVAVSGEYAYVVGQGFSVIDVSTPSAPVEVGYLDMPGYAEDVAISGGYAYVTDELGLRVIDVSAPSAPIEVGFAELPDAAAGIAIADRYVYVAAWRLYVFSECSSEPTPDARVSFIPAAAVAAGAQGSFFQTDVEVNNRGAEAAQVSFQWLPRGEDNSEPVGSTPITLGPGQGLRYRNVLTQVFGLGPNSLGALKLVATTESVIGMSRTYNIPPGKAAGTFGQGLPAIRATEMIAGTDPQRIVFLSEDPDSRANVGCVNGRGEDLQISIAVFNDEGSLLETKTMDLGPYSNNQINRILQDYQPVNGYIDVWAEDQDALYYCYGSVLDNLTSDPTTVLPQ